MGICHKQVIVAYFGKTVVLLRSPVHRGKLTYGISIANFKPGYFRRIFFVLRVFADRRKLIDAVLLAYCSRPLDNNVRAYDCAGADFHIRSYHGKWANRHVISQLRVTVDYCCWVNQINLPLLHNGFRHLRRTRRQLLHSIQRPRYYACF